ncbi:hypothetical protein [Roseateles koreensis]|uniref:Uncharacterized protein n=1 Tax=Roseateles koreensis TaxID=2987526 RepID=A0ABT5KPM8_9BURK|nr:hypothetical protein [Roseateles koreensis]MDC8784878.1 hypothetical protein [Roseateles koreensis]
MDSHLHPSVTARQRYSLTALFAAVANLTACGGGGGASVDTPAPLPTTQSVQIAVIDGAIKGAVVCLDKNANGICDTGEPSGVTDASGKVSLDILIADVGKYPVIASIGTDAVDADHGAITTPYVLSAPADQPAVISPLTDMVQQHLVAAGGTTAAAESFVKAQTGLAASLFSNYISGGDATATIVARTVVLATQAQLDVLKTLVGTKDAAGNTIAQADINNAARQAIAAVLPAVAAAATDASVSGSSSAADKDKALAALATTLVSTQTGLDVTNAAATVASNKAPIDNSAASGTPAAGATLRAFTFTDANNWYYRAMESTAADNTPDANKFTHYYDVHSANVAGTVNTWGYNTDPGRQADQHWNGSAWVACPLGTRSSNSETDATGHRNYNYCDGFEVGTSLRTAQDISGKSLSDVITNQIRSFPGADSGVSYATFGPANMALLGTATFPDQSKLWAISVVPSTAAYAYDVRSSNVVSIFNAAVAAGGNAVTSSTVECAKVNSTNASAYRSAPATLEDMVAHSPGVPCVFAQGSNADGASLASNEWWSNSTLGLGSLPNAQTQPAGSGKYYTTTAALRMSFTGSGNGVNYYNCLVRNADGSIRNCSLLGTGSYKIEALGDARVMSFTGLPMMANRLSYKRIFVERGGQIFYGFQNQVGRTTYTLRLNLPAANALFTQLGMSPIVPQ